MKARQAVVCPKCGALSRPNWEFCARCNEHLEGALPAEERASPDLAEEGEGPASSLSATAIAVATALALLGLGVAAWRYASQAPPIARPDPSLFAFAKQPELDRPRRRRPRAPGPPTTRRGAA